MHEMMKQILSFTFVSISPKVVVLSLFINYGFAKEILSKIRQSRSLIHEISFVSADSLETMGDEMHAASRYWPKVRCARTI